MKKLWRWLGIGIVAIIPAWIVYTIGAKIFEMFDSPLQPLIEWIFGRQIKGVGFAGLVILLAILGWLLSHSGFKKLFGKFEEGLMNYTSTLGSVYRFVRRLVPGGDTKLELKKPVLVQYPDFQLLTLGFVVGEGVWEGNVAYSVLFFSALNPTSVTAATLVAKDRTIDLDMPVAEAMQYAISGGAFGVSKLLERPEVRAKLWPKN